MKKQLIINLVKDNMLTICYSILYVILVYVSHTDIVYDYVVATYMEHLQLLYYYLLYSDHRRP